jgi:hypothetical protein
MSTLSLVTKCGGLGLPLVGSYCPSVNFGSVFQMITGRLSLPYRVSMPHRLEPDTWQSEGRGFESRQLHQFVQHARLTERSSDWTIEVGSNPTQEVSNLSTVERPLHSHMASLAASKRPDSLHAVKLKRQPHFQSQSCTSSQGIGLPYSVRPRQARPQHRRMPDLDRGGN